MKNFFKYTTSALLLALAVAGCTKETMPERVNIQHPSEQSPLDRDNAYYQRLREYKKLKHKIAFGWYGTWTAMGPSYQTRLSNCPDSMDIISIWSQWHSLTPAQQADKEFVQKVKGTKITYTIFADKMPEPFMPDSEKEDASKYTDERIEAFAKAYCKDSMDKWQYDGIDIDYEPGFGASGPFVGHNNELFKKLIIAMGKYVGPKSGTGRLFMIDGVPFAVHTELAEYFDYGIVQAYNSRDYDDLQTRFNNADRKGWKSEQYIFAENFESYWSTGGYPSHKTRDGQIVPSLLGMALFNPTQGIGGGFGAYHMEYEYAHNDMPYKYMRKAIQLVNPAPKGDYSKTLMSVNEAGVEEFSIDVTPSGVLFGEVECSLTGRLATPAKADVEIAFKVDNSLVSLYNSANGTEYKTLATNLVSFSGSLAFAAQSQKSTAAITAQLNDLKTLEDGEYLIPITPDIAENSELSIDESCYIKYLLVNKQVKPISVTLTGSANIQSYSVMHLLDGSYFGTVVFSPKATLSQAALSDIEFGFMSDNELVKIYNRKNMTDYKMVAPEEVTVTGKLQVAKDAKSTTGTATISVNYDALEYGYTMIAVRPDFTTLPDYQADAKTGLKYIVVYKGKQNVLSAQNLEPFESECIKIDNTDNKLGWTTEIKNLGSAGGTGVWEDGFISKMFDGDIVNGWRAIWGNYYSWPRKTGGQVTIDLKGIQTINVIRWYVRAAMYTGTIGKIETSENGQEWTPHNAGDVTVKDAAIQWIKFKEPVDARYIRIVITNSSASNTGMTEIDFWGPKAK